MMPTNLPDLLARGTNHTATCLPTLDPSALAETLVAFANAEGGTSFVGVFPKISQPIPNYPNLRGEASGICR